MAELIQLNFQELGSWCVVGKMVRQEMGKENTIPALWDTCFADGTLQTLEAMGDFVLSPDYVGFMADYQPADNTFVYLVGMMMKPGCPLPEGGFVSREVDASTVAVGWIQGTSTQDVCSPAYELTNAAMEEKGYTSDGFVWSMELYNCPRFTTPDEQGRIILDYYIPCRKR